MVGYQHGFWFYSHPAVYIMILPAFGIISEILPVFSRKPIFGYRAIAYSTAAIGFFGFLVWAHHMFTVGLPLIALSFFTHDHDGDRVPTGVRCSTGSPRCGAASSTSRRRCCLRSAF